MGACRRGSVGGEQKRGSEKGQGGFVACSIERSASHSGDSRYRGEAVVLFPSSGELQRLLADGMVAEEVIGDGRLLSLDWIRVFSTETTLIP
ncbi:hypothetical protein GW17_00009820 [Ensete ventricosum]|nr:hypothetical protein GW17_00009820 [Ensete ventricosum]